MKRQYIDFVPINNRQIQQEPPKPVIRTVQVAYTENLVEIAESPKNPVINTLVQDTIIAKKPINENPAEEKLVSNLEIAEEDLLDESLMANDKLFSSNPTPEYGVIEDYEPLKKDQKISSKSFETPVFKAANVEKRPLSAPHHFVSKKAMQDITAAKAEKISKKPLDLSKKAVKKPTPKKETEDFKTPFINRNVEKRPLSKTVYPPKTIKVSEESSGPVTIINKPEKDAHASLVIVILLTIILGAAVGTVAFLLLPR